MHIQHSSSALFRGTKPPHRATVTRQTKGMLSPIRLDPAVTLNQKKSKPGSTPGFKPFIPPHTTKSRPKKHVLNTLHDKDKGR